MAKRIIDFEQVASRFGLVVDEIDEEHEIYQGIHSIWRNSDNTKFIPSANVIYKLLEQNEILIKRISKLEKIIDNGVVIDDEDRAMLILRHK